MQLFVSWVQIHSEHALNAASDAFPHIADVRAAKQGQERSHRRDFSGQLLTDSSRY
jgi:hypothetical protein